MTAILLDTSALIAVVNREPGRSLVEAALADACLSAVNLVETLAWIRRHDPGAEEGIRAAQLPVIPFGAEEAAIAIRLLATHHGRLSLGDCACLATAERHGLPVLTADRIWAALGLAAEIRLIR